MPQELESLQPIEGANRMLRRRLTLKDEFILAVLPTLVILGVLGLVEVLSQQRLLFASLAASAFLIYLDPQHGTNRIHVLVVSQMMAATIGLIVYLGLGSGYASAGIAMVLNIILMITLDVVHPPAVSTSVSFALRAGDTSNLILFGLAVGITAVLVVLQRAAVWLLARFNRTDR